MKFEVGVIHRGWKVDVTSNKGSCEPGAKARQSNTGRAQGAALNYDSETISSR